MSIDYSSIEYAIYRYSNRLHYLESKRPEMFDVYDKNGEWECTFFGRKSIKSHDKKGKTVVKADIDKEILRLKLDLAELQYRRQAEAIKYDSCQEN
jgi:hypothetical protein